MARQKNLIPVIAVIGPTASGKSDLAVHLARHLKGELISADSRQIYKGLDIGTAKLKPPAGIRQWLVDVVKPNKTLTLAQYKVLADKSIKDVYKRGKTPILVGGTGLYVDAVLNNWQIPKGRPNLALRRRLEVELKQKGLRRLVAKLRRLDRAAAGKIDLKNPRRVIRALELAEAGQSILRARTGPVCYRYLKIGLNPPKTQLEKHLRLRTVKMLKQGLLSETKKILKDYSPGLPALSGIGYVEAAEHLEGMIDRSELIARVTRHSLQYAKRQMTWFKRDPSIIWVTNKATALKAVKKWQLKS